MPQTKAAEKATESLMRVNWASDSCDCLEWIKSTVMDWVVPYVHLLDRMNLLLDVELLMNIIERFQTKDWLAYLGSLFLVGRAQ